MGYYTVTLQNVGSNWFEWTYSAGTKTFSITYYWPEAIQEQYDRLKLFFTKLANANPFVEDDTGNIVRDYDVLDVIENGFDGHHPHDGKTIDEWIEWVEEFAGDLINQHEYFEEMLVWNLLINDGSNVYTSALRIGGTLWASDNSWSITFATTKNDNQIGQDELDLVTMIVGVA